MQHGTVSEHNETNYLVIRAGNMIMIIRKILIQDGHIEEEGILFRLGTPKVIGTW